MKSPSTNRSRIFLVLVIIGFFFRVAFVFSASSIQLNVHSGGSDAPVYVLLAQNLLHHDGLSYAHQPSAFRPPAYPLLLAWFIAIFGRGFIFAIRVLQTLLGIATVVICGFVASELFGRRAGESAFIFGLFLPTLVFSTAQILTECVAAFLTALFLRYLIKQQQNSDRRSAWGLGITAGLESLLRFNAAAMPFLAGLAVFQGRDRNSRLTRLAIVLLVPILVVMPWFIRNEIVFHGAVLYSTHTGANAVQGVLTPQGRTGPLDTDKLMNSMGWCLQLLESNENYRLPLGPEVELNKKALHIVPQLWKQEGWHAFPLLARKIADFWLSTDQLLGNASVPFRERLLRTGGVFAYWIVLILAVFGWFEVRKKYPALAFTLLAYSAGFTILHLPFVMNTRLRIPLMEPLIVILSGPGWLAIADLLSSWKSSLRGVN